MTVRGVRVLLLVAFVVAAAAALLGDRVAGKVLYYGGYVGLVGLAWWTVWRLPAGLDRRPWLLSASTISLWCGGDLAELYEQVVIGKVQDVGVADWFWLGGYVPLVAALTLMARKRAPGRLGGAATDAATVAAAAALAAWQLLVGPLFAARYPLAERLVPALYPICDVVLVAAVLVLALSPGRRGGAIKLLLAAVCLYLTVDIGYNVLPYVMAYSYVQRLGDVLLFGDAVLVAAMLHPDRVRLTEAGDDRPGIHPARLVLLGLALLTAPVLGLLHTGSRRTEVVAVVTCAAIASVVLARFGAAVRAQERAQARLTHRASHDELTGLANRATLTDRIGPTDTVLFLDLDGFKQVNDAYGHDAGDAVLVATADRLRAAVRGTDLVSRLGGDEFVVLCPDLELAGAVALAERILADLAAPVAFHGHRPAVGASIGIAVPGAGSSTPTDLVRAADTAMYTAKRQGRGRIVAHGTAPDGPDMIDRGQRVDCGTDGATARIDALRTPREKRPA